MHTLLDHAKYVASLTKTAPAVVILRGLPGSGKSTLARFLELEHWFTPVSADDHFVKPDGRYEMNLDELPDAHAACMRRFLNAMVAGHPVVVDNTNIHTHELTPYVSVAAAYGRHALVVTVSTPLLTCLKRQTHGVPESVVCRMAGHLYAQTLPPWVENVTIYPI
jgi:predicted kinase